VNQTITPAPLTVTANDQALVYGGTLPTLTIKYSGLVNGDTSASLTTQPTISTTAKASSPVGSYAITANGAVDPNYTISYVGGTLTVTPAALTITAGNQSKVYGAALPALMASYAGFVNGDTSSSLTAQPNVSTTATASSPVGSYSITASGAVDPNYSISYVVGTLTVMPAALTITASNQSKLYGAALPTLSVSYAGFVNGDSSSSLTTQPNVSTTATASSPVGSYSITSSGAVDPNYTISYVAGTLTVTPAALIITANNQSKNYGAALPTLTVSYSGLVNADTSSSLTTQPTISTTATVSSTVGSYSITASGAVDPNYTISYVAGTLTVTPAALTITASNQSKIYGAALPTLTVSYAGFVNGDTSSSLTTRPTLSTTATASSPVGSYAITANGAVDPNYTISYVGGTLSVTPAALTITASNQGKVYGAVLPTLTVSYSGFVNGDSSTSLTTQPSVSTTATASSKVGSYAITASGAVDPNYTISYAAGTLTVTAAALTITANNQNKVYGAALPALTVSYSGFVNGDNSTSLTIQPTVSTTATSSSRVGTYAITASGAVDPNYTISYAAGTLTVTPAALTITANNQSKVYGAALPKLTVSYSGFVNGDSSTSLTTQPSVSTTATASSKVGSYAITASGAVDSNYTISYTAGTLTVTPAALTITANNQSKVYGAALPKLTVSYSGFVNGDTSASLTTQPTVTTAAKTSSPVGSYAITASGAVDPNYTISYTAGTLTVTPAPLTVTANNQTKVYGQANPALTVSYSGFVNGDTSASLTTQPTVSTTATTTSPVGTYAITASGAVDPNYAISCVAGSLTINQDASTTAASVAGNGAFGQMITINATVTAKAPGSGTPTGTVDFYDTTTSEDLGKVALTSGAAALSTSSLAPGSHTITVSYLGDSNFLASSTSVQTMTIGQSIIVLNSTASGALTISNNASITMSGGVYIDSSSSSALTASGNAAVTASVIDVHGGVSKSGYVHFSPAPTTGAAVVSDPLSGLATPSTSGLTNYGSVSLSGNSKATIKPGIYSQISVSGNASLTMNAGLYIIEGGGFSVSVNASVSGTGVTIYNTGSNFPSSGGSYGAITLSGNGTICMSAPTTGPYADVLIFQPAGNTQTLTVSGNSMAGVTGTIYAPAAQLNESANGQLASAIDVNTLSLTGNAIADVVGAATVSAATVGTATVAPAAIGNTTALVAPAYGANPLGQATNRSSGGDESAASESPPVSGRGSAGVQARADELSAPATASLDNSGQPLGIGIANWDNASGVDTGLPRTARRHASVLHDLAAALVSARGPEGKPGASANGPRLTGAHQSGVPVRVTGAGLAQPAAAPAGPRHHERKRSSPADLAAVPGFCGFGSSLRAARSLWEKGISFKWPTFTRRT
jgi:hypothetical protein